MKPIIAANWKMHKTRYDVDKFLKEMAPHPSCEIWIAPSFTTLFYAKTLTDLTLGAQNIHTEAQGAFTGEVSAPQVADAGAKFVILGHSERRRYCGESSAQIKKKVDIAQNYGLIPLLCIGESLEERQAGKTADVLTAQLAEVVTKDFNGVVAYEPVWAIGTGKAATSEMIEEAHEVVRKNLNRLTPHKIPILYGGSVTPDNAPLLSKIKNVDGALVGGASLEVVSFSAIIKGFTS